MLGDEKDIKQAFINLIENAIKYNRENGEVNISLEDNDKQILFIVEDSGLGIPPGDISRLTDRFYRVDLPTSMAVGGTGLGLAIVKNTVTRHNGTLEISSELGKGSSFTLIFNKF
jgi:two-component system phosphate regulon sensor histidine kinase PhoR